MNEIQFLRDQVSLERRHMTAVKDALGAALEARFDEALLRPFCLAAVRYLLFAMQRFHRQDAKHAELLLARLPAEAVADRTRVAEVAAALEGAHAGLGPLAEAAAAAADPDAPAAPLIAACRDYVRWFETRLRDRRHSFHDLFDACYGIEEWRAASFVDADSILEERERFADVRQVLPPGITLDLIGARQPPGR